MGSIFKVIYFVAFRYLLPVLFILYTANPESLALDLPTGKALEDSIRVYAQRSLENEAKENYRDAYHQLLKYNILNDSLFNLEKEEVIEALKDQYEARENQAKIDSLLMEKEYMVLKGKEEVALRRAILIGAVVLLLPAVIVLLIYKQKLKSEQELAIIRDEANTRRINERERMLELQTIKAGLEAREKEKERVASELHNHVALSLAGIKDSLAEMVENENISQLPTVLSTLDTTYQEVRTISHHLAPPSLLTTDFPALLKKYLDEVSENELDITLSVYPENHFRELSQDLQTEVYRIVQECISNIVKHADASHVDMTFTSHEGGISLMIEDDGDGFDPALIQKGGGLQTIRSRVNLINGKLEIDSVRGRGTVISIELPNDGSGFQNNYQTESNKKPTC